VIFAVKMKFTQIFCKKKYKLTKDFNMPNSLPEEQKQLLINILKNPADDGAKWAYSDWLHGQGADYEQQAEAFDWVIGKQTKKPITFASGKKNFENAMVNALCSQNEDHFGFEIKINMEKLLNNENYLGLRFLEQGTGGQNIINFCTTVKETFGEEAMFALVSGYMQNDDLHHQPKAYEHALYKISLDVLGNGSALSDEQKLAVANKIYEKTVNPHFPEHSVAARIIHGLTGEHPEGYVNGYGNRGLLNADEIPFSHHNRVLKLRDVGEKISSSGNGDVFLR
jgi:uncharacterized protein (TIGR02996 family)